MVIAVIGGGAAGMMAALAAAESGEHRVLLLERQARVGRKLAATGNGRCNLTNLGAEERRYHGADPTFVRPALAAFGPERTLAFYRSLGLLTVSEAGGRVYPYSDSANSVVDVLRFSLDARGVETLPGTPAEALFHVKRGFSLRTPEGALEADRVILACGGAAGGKLGGVRDGYRLLESLGHRITPLRPALVQLRTGEGSTRALKGVRAQAALCLKKGERILGKGAGEVQFTEYGLSGPAVFDLSRLSEEGSEMELDVLPRWSLEEVLDLLRRRAEVLPAHPAGNLFTGLVHNRLGRVLLAAEGIAEARPMGSLKGSELQALAYRAKRYCHRITGDLGFDHAQVTAGGADTAEFWPETMESRIVPGLYAVGEVLDVDGDCGGFNLQWAWSSGRAAGKAAAKP